MIWVILMIILVGLDQWTKWFFFVNQSQFSHFEVIKDFFYFTYVENRGAAFGMMQNFRWGFLIITPVVLVFLIIYFIKNRNTLLRSALTFFIAGAVGNFIDRLFRGFVVDFLDFYPFGYDFPVFNAADIFVNIGAALLIIYLIFIYKEPEKEKEEKKEVQEQNGD